MQEEKCRKKCEEEAEGGEGGRMASASVSEPKDLSSDPALSVRKRWE